MRPQGTPASAALAIVRLFRGGVFCQITSTFLVLEARRQTKAHVLFDRQSGIKCVALKHEAAACAGRSYGLAIDAHCAIFRAFLSSSHFEQRRLSATGGQPQANKFPGSAEK